MTLGTAPSDAAQPTAPTQAYATFVGFMDQEASQRLTQWFAYFSIQKPFVHLLFQSRGGDIGEGVYLYNLFSHAPFPLTIYNAGSVSSAAVLAYLGAPHRFVSRHGTFGIHRTSYPTTGPLTGPQCERRAVSLAIDDQRVKDILKRHLDLPDAVWDDLDGNEVWFTAVESVSRHFANDVREFAPPPGARLMDISLPCYVRTP
jgi:ATP-dependent Clp protease protease subunit